MRLSSDGLPFILPPAILTVGAAATGATTVAAVGLILTLCLAAFFRDPERHSDAPADHLVSPADGRVVRVARDDAGRLHLAIFLSVFNVHVARSPAGGELRSLRRIPGPLHAAFREDAGGNARVQLIIDTDDGEVDLALMAGLVARRVLPWVAAPARLRRGQRIAIIRFGSRSELVLPAKFEPRIAVGDRVRAGATVIAAPTPDPPDSAHAS